MPFTKNGDQGFSDTFSKKNLRKDEPIFAFLGELDALNAQIGHTYSIIPSTSPIPLALTTFLVKLQNNLFELGAAINMENSQFEVGHALQELEEYTLTLHHNLPPLKNFILPGGSTIAASLHLCRTQCRKTERSFATYLFSGTIYDETYAKHVLSYLNRLSSWFFVAARFANQALGVPDVIWRPKSKD